MPLEGLGQLIPILGKPFEILSHYATVLIRCKCDLNQPLILVGKGSIVTCPGCRKRYTIAADRGADVGLLSETREGSPS